MNYCVDGATGENKKAEKSDEFEELVRKMNSQQIAKLIDLLFESQLIPLAPDPAIRAFDHQEESDRL